MTVDTHGRHRRKFRCEIPLHAHMLRFMFLLSQVVTLSTDTHINCQEHVLYVPRLHRQAGTATLCRFTPVP
eukprot:4741346-Amphidinium_carterae.1